jgi:hypothetical protein
MDDLTIVVGLLAALGLLLLGLGMIEAVRRRKGKKG